MSCHCLLAWACVDPLPVCSSGCDSDPLFSPSRAAGLELIAEACAMAPHWAVWLLAVGLWGLGIGAEVWWNLVPRKTISSGGECLKLEETDQCGEREASRRCWGKMLRSCPQSLPALFCCQDGVPSMHGTQLSKKCE